MKLLKLLLHMLILNYAKSFHSDLTMEHCLPVYSIYQSLFEIPDHYDIKLEQPK